MKKNKSIGTWAITYSMSVNRVSMWQVLYQGRFDLYYPQRIQVIIDRDFEMEVQHMLHKATPIFENDFIL